ncbi:glycosyltransferase family 2 protein|uniref:Glycosyltransferase 2-like domain-containing protein n=1 Tax=Dendrosporobacter quercicolus TaxID=146817 RepID=A0A1G9WP98_9FIRM|nr:glycosyltransferase family 2 protein [Dendrosporobacter quercicolus]NSL49170.1 glycosyltransferase family 2 protein [Dendrosporobacter quercicolus DSM 1736]SDM86328.1 hypothetical protein SAMN04488502_10845 [Dendrosporobacter quercicolus]
MQTSKVYIIILNWNGWQDTIECLESVFRSNYPNFTVIVCDNASIDNSLDKIKQWANGHIQSYVTDDSKISLLTTPPIKKPLPYAEYTRIQIDQCAVDNEENSPLILIQTGSNLGYAGGNNVGIRYALIQNDFEYIWLLNNDTVVDYTALAQLIKRMKNKPSAGICGSTLLYYDNPDKVQALGGARYNRWLGTSKHIGALANFESLNIDCISVERKIDYIVGASMLVSKKFLNDVGLICEDYFLYFEEIDWITRGRENFELAYEYQSIVYHKEGNSIGSSNDFKERSFTSDYYAIRNRLIFTKKHFKYALISVYIGLIPTIMNRIKRKQWNRVTMIFKVALNALKPITKY